MADRAAKQRDASLGVSFHFAGLHGAENGTSSHNSYGSIDAAHMLRLDEMVSLVGGHGGGRCGAGAVLLRVLLRGGLAGVVGLPGGRRAGPTVRSAWGLHRSSPNSAPRSPLNLHPPRRAAFRFRPGSRAFSGVSHP